MKIPEKKSNEMIKDPNINKKNFDFLTRWKCYSFAALTPWRIVLLLLQRQVDMALRREGRYHLNSRKELSCRVDSNNFNFKGQLTSSYLPLNVYLLYRYKIHSTKSLHLTLRA